MTTEWLILGLLGLAVLYRLCPRRMRGALLLGGSYVLVGAGSRQALVFMLLTALSVWAGGQVLAGMDRKAGNCRGEDRQKRREAKARLRRRKRLVTACVLVLNFGIMALLKHMDVLEEAALGAGVSLPRLFVPLGISFYTFMAAGYLLDVCAGRIPAEGNPLRLALFTGFYPHLLQGPIGRYAALSPQLWAGETPDTREAGRALLRMAWGLFKKKVVADRALLAVNAVFAAPQEQGGAMVLVGVLAYSLQQYADFSGGIDLVLGGARLMGVRLAENFRQPYFADSLGDFWRRWHMTLGAWMKDYVFYPFALSSGVHRLCARVKALPWGNTLSRTLPAALGNLLVFFLVGIWHGTTSNYVVWGLYNGVILAMSALLEPAFRQWASRHPFTRTRGFRLVRILRTFAIVNIGWLFDRCARAGDALGMLGRLFASPRLSQLSGLTQRLNLEAADLWILLGSAALMLAVSLIHERGGSVMDSLMKKPLPLRWAVLLAFLAGIVLCFYTGVTEGFLYAAF